VADQSTLNNRYFRPSLCRKFALIAAPFQSTVGETTIRRARVPMPISEGIHFGLSVLSDGQPVESDLSAAGVAWPAMPGARNLQTACNWRQNIARRRARRRLKRPRPRAASRSRPRQTATNYATGARLGTHDRSGAPSCR
jgi:hypothetical protein